MLYNFALGASAGDGTVFSDVAAEDWFNASIGWAYENGIVDGLGDGTLAPTGSAARAQVAAVMTRFVRGVK